MTPKLRMQHSGAEWMRDQLSYDKKTRRAMSAFGESVADLIGYCWAGIYHLDSQALMKAEWHDLRWIQIAIGPADLATWDFNTLTQLVVVGHDMGIRVSVHPHGTRALKLGFARRDGQYRFDDTERCQARQHPTLEDHVAAIRRGYEVVSSAEAEAGRMP